MVKIYPESIQKGDEIYYLIRSVVCALFFCVCMCVGLIVVLTSMIENEIQDGSF